MVQLPCQLWLSLLAKVSWWKNCLYICSHDTANINYLFLSLHVYTFQRMVLLSFQVTGSQLSQCFAVRNSVAVLAKTKKKAWLSVILWENSNLLYIKKCLFQWVTFNISFHHLTLQTLTFNIPFIWWVFFIWLFTTLFGDNGPAIMTINDHRSPNVHQSTMQYYSSRLVAQEKYTTRGPKHF